MNVALFIARKLQFGNKEKKKDANPSIRIAIIGIALGLAIMLLAVAIVTGFKHEIQGKVIGFGSHIQVTSLSNNTTYETPPIIFPDSLIQSINARGLTLDALYLDIHPCLKAQDSHIMSRRTRRLTLQRAMSDPESVDRFLIA